MLCLLFSVSAKYIPPVLFWIPAFFGLAFPFIFIINFLFIFYWLFQLKHIVLYPIMAMAIAMPTAMRYFNLSKDESVNKSGLIKITTYNSMLFDLYNWKNNKKTRPIIFSNLAENNPGILCLQEFYNSENPKDYHNVDTVIQLFQLPEYHVEYIFTQDSTDHWGIATFSKYPIINRGAIQFNTSENNGCIFTDLVINSDTVRVYNLHLQSISFSDKDTKFMEEMMSDKNTSNEIEKSKNIVRRLKRAFNLRCKQVDVVKAHMNNCKYPIILCGDFNDTAASYAYQTLSENMEDSFLEKGYGFGRTYAGKWPQFRIDFILHSEKLKCLKFTRSSETLTDHYPITAFFEQ
ncbi:MAG: endonuclease/exonuclease/phosphatase family protein [Sphingobacteriaceae bacterium]|nr:endonuclease/exonuclease/phosphatase family protein [Sphingobacteriaceae bacterium]